jgi:cell division protein FtsB
VKTPAAFYDNPYGGSSRKGYSLSPRYLPSARGLFYKEGVEDRIRYMCLEGTRSGNKKDFWFPDGGKGSQMDNLKVSSTWNRKTVRVSLLLAVLVGGWGPVKGEVFAASAPNASSTSESSSGSTSSTDALHDQINELENQIQKLREQSLELQEKTRAKLKSQLEYLQKQRDTLIPRIEKLRDHSETAWQDVKDNIQKAIEDLKQSVDVLQK